LNATAPDNITVTEVGGGTTAADLGIVQTAPQGAGISVDGANVGPKVTNLTKLADLKNGAGIDTTGLIVTNGQTTATIDLSTTFQVDITGATTMQDVINAINTADAGGGVTASFATTGNGIVLTDTTGGAGTLAAISINFSSAAKDLGLDQPAVGSVLTGKDTNGIEVPGVFGNLQKLVTALQSNDQAGITGS